MVFPHFRVGEVNRAVSADVAVGGKAVNTGLALARLGDRCVVTGLNGGDTGRLVARYLAARGVACAFTRTPGPTRTCTTILDNAGGEATELVEEAPRPSRDLLRQFEARGCALLRHAGMAVICGTLPPGVPENLWARLAAAAQQRGVPLVIDSHGAPLLRTLACEPLLAKMTVRELEKTFGILCRNGRDIVAAARRLTAAGARWALITHGARPAILVGREGDGWQVSPPAVAVVSPIGSGDCVNAGVVHARMRGASMLEAVRLGIGCGSANARTIRPADFCVSEARQLAAASRARPLPQLTAPTRAGRR